jgi:predicted enzyme related to lactoylglutathione lyase
MHIECVKYILYVQDMARAARFYRDVLGLKVRVESPHWSEVAFGDAIIGLHGGGDGSRTITALSVQVSDVDAALEEIRCAGGEVVDPPVARPGEPIRLARFADPEGNVVMMTQYVG